jgi:hypothetical protein
MNSLKRKPLKLEFSHNIVEHLGLKLYQNKPTNVIAELISNSWDADAEQVAIKLNQNSKDQSERSISVLDNGHGMNYELIRKHYLVVGKHKRSKQDAAEARSPNKLRKFMGRKGIGKLAPFGIAKSMTVYSRYLVGKQSKFTCFTINLSELLTSNVQSNSNTTLLKSYTPDILAEDISLQGIDSTLADKENFKAFIQFTDKKQTGTAIILENLSLKRAVSEEQLIKGLGRRFTVTLLKNDFTVTVNNTEVQENNALPSFELRIPQKGSTTEIINIDGEDREITYWVGFVDITKTDWPQDQAGVGIYAHGKIAQDRPYFFDIKGREIFTRYMYGVIEADWLDEFPEDVVSTDRTSVDWEFKPLVDLKVYGLSLVKQWINTFKNHSNTNREQIIEDAIKNTPNLPQVSKSEKKVIVNLVARMGPQIDKDKKLQTQVISSITAAWTHTPARELVKNLWDGIGDSISKEEMIIKAIGELNDFLVPESLSVAVRISQRIYAISKLFELKVVGNEKQLQYLIEEFPWILSTSLEQLTADEALATVIQKATQEGLIGSPQIADDITKRNKQRPDFVLFSNANKSAIKVVELKSPEIDLSLIHRQQLAAYIDYIESHHLNAEVTGWLIGKNTNHIEPKDTRISIFNWDEVFTKSRQEHLFLLAAMIGGAQDYADDIRLAQSIEFGGDQTIELLKKMTSINDDFKLLFEKIEQKLAELGRKS